MSTQLAFGLDAPQLDPLAGHRATIRHAIETAAILHGGRVSPNDVRTRLVGLDVPPRLVGQVYAALRREGHLVPYGTERSDDVRGGNGGRLIETYRWVEVPT